MCNTSKLILSLHGELLWFMRCIACIIIFKKSCNTLNFEDIDQPQKHWSIIKFIRFPFDKVSAYHNTFLMEAKNQNFGPFQIWIWTSGIEKAFWFLKIAKFMKLDFSKAIPQQRVINLISDRALSFRHHGHWSLPKSGGIVGANRENRRSWVKFTYYSHIINFFH